MDRGQNRETGPVKAKNIETEPGGGAVQISKTPLFQGQKRRIMEVCPIFFRRVSGMAAKGLSEMTLRTESKRVCNLSITILRL